jgi:hypothetical protein
MLDVIPKAYCCMGGTFSTFFCCMVLARILLFTQTRIIEGSDLILDSLILTCFAYIGLSFSSSHNMCFLTNLLGTFSNPFYKLLYLYYDFHVCHDVIIALYVNFSHFLH